MAPETQEVTGFHRDSSAEVGIDHRSVESQVIFDTTRHFSEGAIRKRSLERLKLQEQEHVQKRGKKGEGVERAVFLNFV
ncbi:hypothetical protein GRJ2_001982300 [Grus japonensis]|uniref:Uncharacterized protein n=1 Tax=Grus japonensis TaxID=30415 RepID=A0ABC9XBW5_GRUJA